MLDKEKDMISENEICEEFKTEYEKITSDEANEERMAKILNLSDRMLEKLSYAIDELSLCETKEKTRIKEVEYDDEYKKPLKETNTEIEKSEIAETLIDTGALKQLVSTLKDIKDIQQSFIKSDSDEESESGVIVISEVEKTQGETT